MCASRTFQFNKVNWSIKILFKISSESPWCKVTGSVHEREIPFLWVIIHVYTFLDFRETVALVG